ncbi:hypothetical protein LCGC14_1364670 [marine sediment metagenome]|uniref:Putative tail fiber protein gp53-like C-terminal domain-containing protein n=1 Tax=marine sediment metagenome TaxID=412755 RepID=A0A0F9K7K8_9ZZZZ
MTTKVIGDWNEFIADLIVGGANSLQIGEVLIQWGNVTPSSGEGSVTFPIAYTSTPTVSHSIVHDSTISTIALSTHLSAISITAFTVQSRRVVDTGAGTTDVYEWDFIVYWIAIGINNA